jgi:hypothetical protein
MLGFKVIERHGITCAGHTNASWIMQQRLKNPCTGRVCREVFWRLESERLQIKVKEVSTQRFVRNRQPHTWNYGRLSPYAGAKRSPQRRSQSCSEVMRQDALTDKLIRPFFTKKFRSRYACRRPRSR